MANKNNELSSDDIAAQFNILPSTNPLRESFGLGDDRVANSVCCKGKEVSFYDFIEPTIFDRLIQYDVNLSSFYVRFGFPLHDGSIQSDNLKKLQDLYLKHNIEGQVGIGDDGRSFTVIIHDIDNKADKLFLSIVRYTLSSDIDLSDHAQIQTAFPFPMEYNDQRGRVANNHNAFRVSHNGKVVAINKVTNKKGEVYSFIVTDVDNITDPRSRIKLDADKSNVICVSDDAKHLVNFEWDARGKLPTESLYTGLKKDRIKSSDPKAHYEWTQLKINQDLKTFKVYASPDGLRLAVIGYEHHVLREPLKPYCVDYYEYDEQKANGEFKFLFRSDMKTPQDTIVVDGESVQLQVFNKQVQKRKITDIDILSVGLNAEGNLVKTFINGKVDQIEINKILEQDKSRFKANEFTCNAQKISLSNNAEICSVNTESGISVLNLKDKNNVFSSFNQQRDFSYRGRRTIMSGNGNHFLNREKSYYSVSLSGASLNKPIVGGSRWENPKTLEVIDIDAPSQYCFSDDGLFFMTVDLESGKVNPKKLASNIPLKMTFDNKSSLALPDYKILYISVAGDFSAILVKYVSPSNPMDEKITAYVLDTDKFGITNNYTSSCLNPHFVNDLRANGIITGKVEFSRYAADNGLFSCIEAGGKNCYLIKIGEFSDDSASVASPLSLPLVPDVGHDGVKCDYRIGELEISKDGKHGICRIFGKDTDVTNHTPERSFLREIYSTGGTDFIFSKSDIYLCRGDMTALQVNISQSFVSNFNNVPSYVSLFGNYGNDYVANFGSSLGGSVFYAGIKNKFDLDVIADPSHFKVEQQFLHVNTDRNDDYCNWSVSTTPDLKYIVKSKLSLQQMNNVPPNYKFNSQVIITETSPAVAKDKAFNIQPNGEHTLICGNTCFSPDGSKVALTQTNAAQNSFKVVIFGEDYLSNSSRTTFENPTEK